MRKAEDACPFCGGSVFEGTTRVAPRLSRGAMLGAVAVALACSSPSTGDDAGSDAAQETGAQPAYGAPVDAAVIDAAAKDAAPDSPVAAYGGPPVDAGDG